MAVRDRHDSTHSSRLCGQCKQRREVIAQLGVATGNNCARASLPSLDDRRDGRRHSQRATRAGLQADSSPAPLLLPRDVRPAGHERSWQRDLVSGRTGTDLLDAGVALAATDRLGRSRAADRRRRLRLSARLVTRRPSCRLYDLPPRRARALAARSGERRHPGNRGRWRGQRRPALVAGRLPTRLRLDVIRRPLAHLRRAGARWTDRHSRARHRGSRQRSAPLLLQRAGITICRPRGVRMDAS